MGIVFVCLHVSPLVAMIYLGLPLLLILVDKCIWLYNIKRSFPVESSTSLSGGVTCVKVQTSQSFKPGDYYFISFPAVSFFEHHPISISCAPGEEYLTFHIKAG